MLYFRGNHWLGSDLRAPDKFCCQPNLVHILYQRSKESNADTLERDPPKLGHVPISSITDSTEEQSWLVKAQISSL